MWSESTLRVDAAASAYWAPSAGHVVDAVASEEEEEEEGVPAAAAASSWSEASAE